MSKLCEKLVNNGLANYSQIQGCSIEEIQKIEEYFQYPLPKTYKEFLYYMGYRAGRFFAGTDIFYHRIFELKEGFNDLLNDDNSDFKLKETDFVFASHQGYQFMYFNLCENDNPPVYYYFEGDMFPHKKWETFSDFLYENMEEYIK